MVRRKDRFWEYAEELKGRFRCKFCHKDYPGGIARVKSHLSRQSGRDIAICNSVPEDVQALAFIAVRGKDFPYKKRKAVAYATNSEANGVDLSLNPVTTCPDSSINLHQDPAPRICNKKDKEVVDKMVAQAFIMNNIPFDVTQSSSFISMVMAVADYGTGYTLPNHNTLCTKLVRDARNEVEEYVSMVKKSWSLTGCTLMSDVWTDVRGCSFINFVAYSAKGTIFLKSFERTDERIGVFVGDMLLSVIDEIGAKNVVQIIVNNSSSYEYASDLVMGRYPQIYKTQCVAHEIQGLLKDFYDGVGWIRSVFDNVELIVDYMYNYDDVLKLLRIHIGDKELRRPCRTRFSSHFVMLQSVIEVKDNLRLMIMSGEWLDVINNKSSMGEQVSRLIESATFWDGVKEVILLLEPLTRVLCLVEGEGSTTGYLYDAMERARSELKQLYTVDKLKYLELWELFNSRWCDRIVHKIHAAAAFFNPSLMYYGKIKYEQPDIRDGMNYVAESLVGINEMDDFAAQLLLYNGRSPKMFNTLSVVMMKKAHPRVWWEDNGGEVPLLRKVAIRILSQPCSFPAFARSWSAFEVAKTKRINKLSEEGLEDLVYARMNSKMMKCYNDLEMKNKFAINLEKLEELHENIDNNYQEIDNGEGTATLMLDDIVGPRSPSRLSNSTI